MNTEPVNMPSTAESSGQLSTGAYIRALMIELNISVPFEFMFVSWLIVTTMAAGSFMGSVPPSRIGDFFDVASDRALYVFFIGVFANATICVYVLQYYTVRYISAAHHRAMKRLGRS